MKYCADSWFLLSLMEKDQKSSEIFNNARQQKDWIFIPISAFSETTKKLLQKGVPKEKISAFLSQAEFSDRVTLVSLTKEISWEAANIAHRYGIPLLDSFVAATAKINNVDALISGDEHFLPLKKARYLSLLSW